MADGDTATPPAASGGTMGFVKKHKGAFIAIGVIVAAIIVWFVIHNNSSSSSSGLNSGTTATPNTIAVPGPQGPTGPRGFRGPRGKTVKQKKKKKGSSAAAVTNSTGSHGISPAHVGSHTAGMPAYPTHTTFPQHNPRAVATGHK